MEGIPMTKLRPANMGFAVAWTAPFRARFAGQPLKRITLTAAGRTARGEALLTEAGIEGGAVYALSGPLRDTIDRDGTAILQVDLRPDLDATAVATRLAAPRGGRSLSAFLTRTLALSPAAVGLVQEALHAGEPLSPALIKALPIRLIAPFGLDRAISTAGGLAWDALDETLMLHARPGTFAAGEMLDWDAPTGGWLLTAAIATGRAAGRAAASWAAR